MRIAKQKYCLMRRERDANGLHHCFEALVHFGSRPEFCWKRGSDCFHNSSEILIKKNIFFLFILRNKYMNTCYCVNLIESPANMSLVKNAISLNIIFYQKERTIILKVCMKIKRNACHITKIFSWPVDNV